MGFVQRGWGHLPVSELSALVGHYHSRDAFRHSATSALKLIFEMDAQRRREELRRLVAPPGYVTYSTPSRVNLFWWKWDGQEDTYPVFARDIRDFGWDRALERVPGVVIH